MKYIKVSKQKLREQVLSYIAKKQNTKDNLVEDYAYMKDLLGNGGEY